LIVWTSSIDRAGRLPSSGVPVAGAAADGFGVKTADFAISKIRLAGD
jgi:hypothetical protein